MAQDDNFGMGKDEDSRTRPGEKDYTGHEGDDSETHPGKKDYSKEELADHLALEARDGDHLLELLEEAGWDLSAPDGDMEALEDEGPEMEDDAAIAIPLGGPMGMPPMGGKPKLDIVAARFKAAENAVKGKGKGRKRGER